MLPYQPPSVHCLDEVWPLVTCIGQESGLIEFGTAFVQTDIRRCNVMQDIAFIEGYLLRTSLWRNWKWWSRKPQTYQLFHYLKCHDGCRLLMACYFDHCWQMGWKSLVCYFDHPPSRLGTCVQDWPWKHSSIHRRLRPSTATETINCPLAAHLPHTHKSTQTQTYLAFIGSIFITPVTPGKSKPIPNTNGSASGVHLTPSACRNSGGNLWQHACGMVTWNYGIRL